MFTVKAIPSLPTNESQFLPQTQGEFTGHLKGLFHCLLTVGIYQTSGGRREHTAGKQKVPVNTLFAQGSPDFDEFFFQAI